jgi:hypothetical protein
MRMCGMKLAKADRKSSFICVEYSDNAFRTLVYIISSLRSRYCHETLMTRYRLNSSPRGMLAFQQAVALLPEVAHG